MNRQFVSKWCLSSRLLVAVTLLLLSFGVLAQSATPAGTVIRNQASASYVDENGVAVTVTSNFVETLVEQVAGLDLTNDQQLLRNPGAQVDFPHRITNTGNGTDRYGLQVSNLGGDIFDLTGLAVLPDLNEDGVADSNTPITETPWLTPGESFNVIVRGNVPGSVISGDQALVSLLAISDFNPGESADNTDTITVTTGASIAVVKSMDITSGVSPSGPFEISLRVDNTGDDIALDVVVLDALPAGMSYVAGTARWNGSPTILTDANPNDSQSVSGHTLRYCAYNASCSGLPEANSDGDLDSTNQATLTIATLADGDGGTLTFQVSIDAGLSAGTLQNTGEFEFDASGTPTARQLSNTVVFTVLPTASVVANGSTATSIDGMNEPVTVTAAAQGGIVEFSNVIWNTGNATDTFNMIVDTATTTFPVGTVYQLRREDGATPLVDSNSDGTVDTGPVAPGAFQIVVLRMELPDGVFGNNGGVGFDISKRAVSVQDSTVFNDVTDHLDEIIGNQVDLTNQAPAGSAGALGVGPGPEAAPVSTLTVAGGQSATFDLFIRHQGFANDTYILTAAGSAGGAALPAGWQVNFTDATTGAVVTNTGTLASGASAHIIATVTTPAGAAPGLTSVFFGAASSTSGATDVKHDAVQISAAEALRLEPSLTSQVAPGGSVIYEHTLTNTGNSAINDIDLAVTQTVGAWTAVLYADTDGDGAFSAGDLPVSGSIAMAVAESLDLFLQVFAPANSPVGQTNVSTITASWNAGADAVDVTDTTQVSLTRVAIRKEQAVDMGCDGTPDSGSSFGPDQIVVAPGNNCILYRLTAINQGTEVSYNVKIVDSTPPYTVYQPAAMCSRSPCWLVEPAGNGTGSIEAETDQLLPGDNFFLQFSVRVE